MRPQSIDTDLKTEEHLLEKFREMTESERFFKTINLSDFVINQSKAAINEANPGLSEFEKKLLFISVHYGEDLAEKVRKKYLINNE